MSPARLARAVPVRYALVFAGGSALLMAVLLTVIYWWMSSLLARHLDERIEAQFQVLRTGLAQDGRESLLGLVREHERKYRDSPLHYLVQDRDGAVLAGDLPPMRLQEGWHDIVLQQAAADNELRHQRLRGRGEWLSDELFVIVTNDTRDLHQTRTLILASFAVALAGTVAIALGGGLLIGKALLGRVDAVNRTARAIMAGDLSRRVPVVGPRDELGGLAEILNDMLGRIEELMANLQHVTSDIAHDLRTPLGRQRQRLEAILADPGLDHGARNTIEAAVSDADTMLMTFEAMLRIAQIEAGARRARFQRVNMSGVAENVVDALAAVAEDAGQGLEADVQPGVQLHGDAELLTQMLVNLVENGIRHTPPGTALTLRLVQTAAAVRLSVSDTGRGIPEAERERVFDRFYRLDQSRSTPGSGLGLSLVAAVAKLHGARVTLLDNRPGLRIVLDFDRPASAAGGA